jgi:hypothetical protein
VEDLAVVSGERGYWPPYVRQLRDAATEGSSESVFVVDHRVQISDAEVWSAAEGGRERWPFDTSELIVFVADVAIVGHSMSESTDGVRNHRFLLNNRECVTIPYLAHQLSVFCKSD